MHPSDNVTATVFALIATELTRSDTTDEHRETRYIKALTSCEMTKELVSGWRLRWRSMHALCVTAEKF